jgi:tetratricopeptide (TPR) repeat protein
MSMELPLPEFSDALAAYFKGDHNTALKAFTRLAEAHPDNASVFIFLGNVNYALGFLEEALRNYEKAAELEPKHGHAYYKLGVCAFRAGHLERALDAFSENISLEGQSHAMSDYWVGLIDYFLGRDDAALEAFNRLKEASPESLFANFFMAQLLIKHNRCAEALVLLAELVEKTPTLSEAHYLMGQAYRCQYKNVEAIESFRKALAIAPGDKRVQAQLENLVEVSSP